MRFQRPFFAATTVAVLLAVCGCSHLAAPADPAASIEVSLPYDPQPALQAMVMPPLVWAEARIDFAVVSLPVDADLWQRVRRGFVMGEMASPRLQEQELWYANRPDYINRFVERGSRYLYHIVEEVERRGLPTEIVLLPIIESAFNPQAFSRANASGMWQFIPSTGKIFGLKQDWLTDNRRDVLLSTNAALDYLTKLYGMFNSWELAFAAYNCGEGCVGRAIATNQRRGLPTDFASLNLPKETRSYVPKLIAVKNIILSPGSYGITLPSVVNRPYFTPVTAPEKIDVKLAARLAEMPAEEFAQLNPSFSKPVAASGSGYFLVPTEKAATFKTNLDLYRSLNGPMVSWTTVTANRGQAVDAVARRHGMTASYLRATNGPFKERKGKFTQPVTFMAPNPKDADAISVAFDKKVSLKREQQIGATSEGDDGPINVGSIPRENLRLAKADIVGIPAKPVAIAVAIATSTARVIDAPQPQLNAAPVSVSAVTELETMTYVVQKSDTLFSIAKRSELPLDDLKAMNQLTSNTVKIGQELRVRKTERFASNGTVDATEIDSHSAPDQTNRVATVSTSARTSTSAASPGSKRVHTVRSGDTLFSLARRFNTSIADLLAWNRLTAKAVLKTGLRLKVSR